VSYLPTAPKAVSYGNRVLRVLLGIGGGLKELRPSKTRQAELKFFSKFSFKTD
jgi:hypothetical protein